MAGNPLVLLLGVVAGLGMNLMLQVILVRMVSGSVHVRIQFVSAIMGLVSTVVLLLISLRHFPLGALDRAGYLILHVLIYCCLAFCLFNIVNANVSSLRMRLLREYLRQDPRPISDAAILRQYSARQILETRLLRLTAGRQIELRGGRYYARWGIVSFICWCFGALRWFLLRT
jgi:hypothetical protein